MVMIRGTDSDNYDGIVPIEHFEKLRTQYGVRFNIIGLEARMPYAYQQREACELAGIDVPFAYKFLYWQTNDLERLREACGFGKPIALDCEYGTNWDPDRIVTRIHEARDLLLSEGLYWGIYTGSWWWPKTGDTHDFATDRLWHAAYPFGNGLPPLHYLPTSLDVDYGGWVRATVQQYANNCYEDGPWAFDLNAMEEVVLPPPPPPPPPYVIYNKIGFSDGTEWYLEVKEPPHE